ncbi:MAG: hypothetical protein EOM24_03165 [Chloroflexia bacterium]|nr:hypothetical protein [Chloroflexia bacterium]
MSTQISTTVHDAVGGAVIEGLALAKGEMPTQPSANQVPMPGFHTGLATMPQHLPRQVFGLAAQLVVPPGSWAVVHLPGGETTIYTPGSYWLWCAPGAILVQWVDARRQQVVIGPIEGWSADKWRFRLWMSVDLAVADPLIIAAHREPIVATIAAARAAVLAYIERYPHAALTGCQDEHGGMDGPAAFVQARLCNDPALAGLEIISVRVLDRQGDERQIEAATAATVAAAQIDEGLRVDAARHRARLQELAARATESEREHSLRMSAGAAEARERLLRQQAEVQQATLAAQLEITMAQIKAHVAEIAHDEQSWQKDQARYHLEWERLQQQQAEAHRTEQEVRLLEVQHGLVRTEGELALAAQERQHAQLLALADLQQSLTEQRDLRAQAVAERREQHERALLDLRLRHDALVAEQMTRLEQWRVEHRDLTVAQQRQHDRQLAGIAGAARIAAAAAHSSPTITSEGPTVADAGLKLLQDMTE